MIQSRTTIFVLLFTLVLPPAIGRTATLPQAPSIDPPQVTGEPQAGVVYKEKTLLKKKNQTEWSYHKSADGHHPNGAEQQMMWLMNRARANPAAEGEWPATETNPDVTAGRDYFNVNLITLQNEFSSLIQSLRPPLIFVFITQLMPTP